MAWDPGISLGSIISAATALISLIASHVKLKASHEKILEEIDAIRADMSEIKKTYLRIDLSESVKALYELRFNTQSDRIKRLEDDRLK